MDHGADGERGVRWVRGYGAGLPGAGTGKGARLGALSDGGDGGQGAEAVAQLGKKLRGRVMLWVHCLLRVCFPSRAEGGFLGWRGGGCCVGVGVRSGFLGGKTSWEPELRR